MNQKKQYVCVVCGYSGLDEPLYKDSANYKYATHDSCPSCGFESGYSDDPYASGDLPEGLATVQAIKFYRNRWIKEGMKFKHLDHKFEELSEQWDPKEQLLNIGIDLNKSDWENSEPTFSIDGIFLGLRK